MEMEVVRGKPKSCFVVTGTSFAPAGDSCDDWVAEISVGGLLAADALIQFVQNRPDAEAPLWPRIIACLAFDTPVCSHPAPRIATTKRHYPCSTWDYTLMYSSIR